MCADSPFWSVTFVPTGMIDASTSRVSVTGSVFCMIRINGRDGLFHFAFNQVAHLAERFGRQVFRVGNLPVFADFRAHERTGIAAAHGRHKIILDVRYLREGLRGVRAEVVTEFLHSDDGFGIDDAGRTGTGAVRVDVAAAVDARE